MHAAIFLFFAGLVDFLFSINDEVARVISVAVYVLAATYIVMTALPVYFHQCPYQTPLTSFIWYTHHFFTMGALCSFSCSNRIRTKIGQLSGKVRRGFYQDVVDGAERKTKFDEETLRLALTSCSDDDQLETFLEAMPSYLRGEVDLRSHVDDLGFPTHVHDVHLRARVNNIGLLLKASREDPQLGRRIVQLLASCTDVNGRMDSSARRRRAITCAYTIREMSRAFSSASQTVDLLESTCKVLHQLSQDRDPGVALAALNTIATLENALLKQLSESDKRKDPSRDKKADSMLRAIRGEWDPLSAKYQHGQSSDHKSDGRLIAVAKFISSILALIPHMGHPSHGELDTTRRTFVELFHDLHREIFSTSAQHSFAESLAELITHAAMAKSTGMHSLRSLWFSMTYVVTPTV
jgi:hypothetical protein